MARRKKKRRSKPKPSVLDMAMVGAVAAPAVRIATQSGSMTDKIATAQHVYTGYNASTGQFEFNQLVQTYGPPVAIAMVKKGLRFLGVRTPSNLPIRL